MVASNRNLGHRNEQQAVREAIYLASTPCNRHMPHPFACAVGEVPNGLGVKSQTQSPREAD